MGWKVEGKFPDIPKSIVVVAPHTSYWDAILGKLFLLSFKVNHRFLSKKELFYFPMNIIMYLFGAVPVGGVKNRNAIHDACNLLHNANGLHVVICPEGRFARTERWNSGFYYMAFKADVPIVVAYLDYRKKEIGVKGVITDLSDINNVYKELTGYYVGVSAKYPEDFALPKYKQI